MRILPGGRGWILSLISFHFLQGFHSTCRHRTLGVDSRDHLEAGNLAVVLQIQAVVLLLVQSLVVGTQVLHLVVPLGPRNQAVLQTHLEVRIHQNQALALQRQQLVRSSLPVGLFLLVY